MSFHPGPSKKAQEVIFSRKIKKLSHSSLVFNNDYKEDVYKDIANHVEKRSET